MKKETTSTPANGKAYALGETITYKITVTNDGNLTLTNVVVTDDKTGDEWIVETMKPGDTETFEAEYVVTEADILAGEVVNVATAKGKSPDPDNPEPEDEDEDPEPTEDPNGHLTVIKETTSITPEGGYKLGDTLNYRITVVNDGNLTITDIKVTDDRTGDAWTIDSLAPGESKEFEAATTVTEEDIISGHIINEATATGKSPDPDNPDVPVTPGTTDDDPEDPNGHITIEKVTTSKPEDERGYKPGETITYKITVKNDGNLTITDITVTDELTGDEWTIESLAPGAEKVYETSYTVTEKDAEAGKVLNVATATGKSPDPDKPDVPVTPGEDPEPTLGKFTLTIEYRYQNGATAAETYTDVLYAGDEYDVQSPYIPGYYTSQPRVTGTMPARDVLVTVIYLERNTITIEDFETPLGTGLGSINAGETIE